MNQKKKRILFVEDYEDTSYLAKLILEHYSLEVTTATTAAEGLRLAREQKFNLYLIDQGLPDFPGIELCRLIRERDAKTPIIFFSGRGLPSDKEEAFSAGAQAYIVKPAAPEELISAVREHLGQEIPVSPVQIFPL